MIFWVVFFVLRLGMCGAWFHLIFARSLFMRTRTWSSDLLRIIGAGFNSYSCVSVWSVCLFRTNDGNASHAVLVSLLNQNDSVELSGTVIDRWFPFISFFSIEHILCPLTGAADLRGMQQALLFAFTCLCGVWGITQHGGAGQWARLPRGWVTMSAVLTFVCSERQSARWIHTVMFAFELNPGLPESILFSLLYVGFMSGEFLKCFSEVSAPWFSKAISL